MSGQATRTGQPPGRAVTPDADGTAGEDDRLRAVVEGLLAPRLGSSERVASVSSVPSRFARRSPAEVVTARLSDGTVVTLFLKRLGRVRPDHPDQLRRDREVMVYSRLLAGRDLPAPVFYGSHWDPATRRHEVFLEHVDDWSLKYQSLEHWTTAARRLAGLHAHFAARRRELAEADFLLRLDSAYFRAWAARALTAVRGASSGLARWLARLLRDHGEVAGLLSGQRPTLVHNDLAPKNVLADTSRAPARICFVDWEMAGVGPGLLDLVHLTHGLPQREERRLVSAYCAELRGTGLVPARSQLRRVLAACALQNTLYRLAHIAAWRVGAESVESWVDDVDRLRRAL